MDSPLIINVESPEDEVTARDVVNTTMYYTPLCTHHVDSNLFFYKLLCLFTIAILTGLVWYSVFDTYHSDYIAIVVVSAACLFIVAFSFCCIFGFIRIY